jgi:hypothetical protein
MEIIKVRKEKCKKNKCDKCKKWGNHHVVTWKWNSEEDGRFQYRKAIFTWSDTGYLI